MSVNSTFSPLRIFIKEIYAYLLEHIISSCRFITDIHWYFWKWLIVTKQTNSPLPERFRSYWYKFGSAWHNFATNRTDVLTSQPSPNRFSGGKRMTPLKWLKHLKKRKRSLQFFSCLCCSLIWIMHSYYYSFSGRLNPARVASGVPVWCPGAVNLDPVCAGRVRSLPVWRMV